jgi:DNA-binding NarL/FixJ family response regulator
LKLFVLDPHTIYRRGLVACLELMAEVDSVAHAGSVREAWEDPGLLAADLVILDTAAPGGPEFIGAAQEAAEAGVLVCASECGDADVIAAMQAGAVGFLRKETLTADSLGDAVRAAASGSRVVTPDLLDRLVAGLQVDERPAARLTDREQQVLALIAEGHPTREVALQLSYSERTVKNVLHDVVTKLNARSGSQAVAFAVREGLI